MGPLREAANPAWGGRSIRVPQRLLRLLSYWHMLPSKRMHPLPMFLLRAGDEGGRAKTLRGR